MATNAPQTKNQKITNGTPRLIVKYTGRRYYDTVKPGITNLGEILGLAKKGVRLKIYSRRVKADVTLETLLRAMVTHPPKALSLRTLETILRD